MSTSILRFTPFSFIPVDKRDNPEYYYTYYTNSEVSFSVNDYVYLRSRQTENSVVQYCNASDWMTKLDYELIRYSESPTTFTSWKIASVDTLDYTYSNLVNHSNRTLKSLKSSDDSINITFDAGYVNITTSGGGITGDYVEINEFSNLNNTTTKKIKNLEVSGGLALTNSTDKLIISPGNCALAGESNLLISGTKNLADIRIVNTPLAFSPDEKIKLSFEDYYINLDTGNILNRYRYNGQLSNLQSSGYLKSLFTDGVISITDTTDSMTLTNTKAITIDTSSNLIIPGTKTLNTLRVTNQLKSAEEGKIQLTQEDGYLTINVGNTMSRFQEDKNLSNLQSSGNLRSIVFPNNEFSQNTTNGSQLRFYNNKLITNNSVSGVVSNIICRNSSSVVQKELKNIVAGENITLTNDNETLTIGVTSMSGADFGLFKWTTFTKTATPGQENTNEFYGFTIANNQYIYLKTMINKSTFEIENDNQDYDSGLPTKNCIFDLTQSTKSCYLYWAGKFTAKWLRQGCIYQFIYTPSNGFNKITMINDNDDTHSQIIDTPTTSPALVLRELHNRDTYRFNCKAGELNTLYLLTYDDIISLGCSIDIFGMNMNIPETVLKVVLCNSDGVEFNVDDAKKVNHKFTNDPHVSRNVGFNPWWDGSSNKELSFFLQSDKLEYMNVLHLDISNGNYIVWY